MRGYRFPKRKSYVIDMLQIICYKIAAWNFLVQFWKMLENELNKINFEFAMAGLHRDS
jgi:hypothetical protein